MKHNSINETTNNSEAVLTLNSWSGSLQIFSINLSSKITLIKTMVFCDTGSALSSLDRNLRDQLDVQGNALTLNIAGLNGAREIASEKVRIKNYNSECVGVSDFRCSPSNVTWEQVVRLHQLETNLQSFGFLPKNSLDLKKVKVVQERDNYHLLFPVEYSKGKQKEP